MTVSDQLQRDVVLYHADCLSLLAAGSLGRVIFTVEALPAVEPVTFILDGDTVVFRARAGSSVSEGTRNDIVAFQVDDIEMNQGDDRWWTVTVTGRSEIVTDPVEVNRLATLPLASPAIEHAHFVVIRIDVIQGWRHNPPS